MADSALLKLIALLETAPEDKFDRLIEGMGSTKGVYEMDAQDISEKSGLSNKTAQAIDIVDELTRYIGVEKLGREPILDSFDKQSDYFRAVLYGRHVEYCYAAYLSARKRLLRLVLLQKGTIDSSTVYMRDIVRGALLKGTKYVVLAHNHPGGTLRPSYADVSLTQNAIKTLKLLDVELLDHIVVTDGGAMGIIKGGYVNV